MRFINYCLILSAILNKDKPKNAAKLTTLTPKSFKRRTFKINAVVRLSGFYCQIIFKIFTRTKLAMVNFGKQVNGNCFCVQCCIDLTKLIEL